jgi:hypothetical protein
VNVEASVQENFRERVFGRSGKGLTILGILKRRNFNYREGKSEVMIVCIATGLDTILRKIS